MSSSLDACCCASLDSRVADFVELYKESDFRALGAGAYGITTAAAAFAIFFLVKITMGLRVSEEEEFEGLDVGEHGLEAYPDLTLRSSSKGVGI